MTFQVSSPSLSIEPRVRYHGVQRSLHWIMAAVIFGALGIGLYCSYLDHGSSQRQLLMDIHKSLGMTALALLIIRIPVRAVTSSTEGRTVPWFGMFHWPIILRENKPFGRAVGVVHHYGAYAFYALLALHLGAVVWHRLVKRDEVLARML